MLADALRTYYGYNRWATQRVLDVAEQLTQDQLHTPGTAGHGSVRDTLVHLIAVQRRWLSWWDETLPADQAYFLTLDPADYPDLPAVRREWEAIEAQTEAFVSGLTDDDTQRVYSYTLPDGTEAHMILWHMMMHVANHGTQHRSEVAAMLTDFGHSPGDLDLLGYIFASGA